MADTVSNAIESNATGPKKAQDQAGSVEQHPLADQIAADRYLEARAASRKSGSLGIRLQKISPGGAE